MLPEPEVPDCCPVCNPPAAQEPASQNADASPVGVAEKCCRFRLAPLTQTVRPLRENSKGSMKTNVIHTGDNTEVLKSFPDGCIDLLDLCVLENGYTRYL